MATPEPVRDALANPIVNRPYDEPTCHFELGRTDADVDALDEASQEPLNEKTTGHSAAISCDEARRFGLPAQPAVTPSETWAIIWSLLTRYSNLDTLPIGVIAVCEGDRAPQIICPQVNP